MYWTIYHGHKSTAMISWGAILSSEQIDQLVAYIGELYANQKAISSGEPIATISPEDLSFERDVLPIFTANCNMCHGSSGGWDGTSYDSAMSSGDHTPVIIPGDETNSLLAQKVLGTQKLGGIMPPYGSLSDAEIRLILEWIKAGAAK
jgi:mono/diheme cytochrome c family protein